MIVARHPVVQSGDAAGEVLALRHGPPPALSTRPFGPHAGLLLLSLPLAILLAAVAGLLVFRILLRRIRELETEMEADLEEKRARFHYHLEDRRTRFDQDILALHRRLRTGWLRYLLESPPSRTCSRRRSSMSRSFRWSCSTWR